MTYHSRCPCLKADMSCTKDCKCRNYDNPYGTSGSELQVSCRTEIKHKRKRARHFEQDQLREPSKKYMEKMDEQPLCGMWTAEEHYIFLAITEHIKNTHRNVTAELLCQIYTDVVQSVQYECISLSLSSKSMAQINSKLQHLTKEELTAKTCGLTSYLPS